jgi:hypothetical protein
MADHITYCGKPFYSGRIDKEIFPGHVFTVSVHPLHGPYCDCPLSPHIHARSVRYPDFIIALYDGEYTPA